MNGPFDGKRWPFASGIVVGRDPSAAEAAIPTDCAVSRRHASLQLDGTLLSTDSSERALTLTDLDSRNGTYVDGRRITNVTQIRLGQPFIVGRTMLQVLAVSASAQNGLPQSGTQPVEQP